MVAVSVTGVAIVMAEGLAATIVVVVAFDTVTLSVTAAAGAL
jgi:hypothetical protein